MMHTIKAGSLVRWVTALTALLLTTLIVAPPAGAADPGKPQLSIAIDNGRTSAKVGDTLTYTTVVKNLGPDVVKRLRITQSMPPGLKARSAGSDGVLARETVVWHVSLKSSGKAVLKTRATVSKTPKQTLRLASVACASTKATAPPIVCASHSDQLAAGAAAQDAAASAADDGGGQPWWWTIAGLIIVLLAALVLVRVRTRPGRPRTSGAVPGTQGGRRKESTP